MGTGCVPVVRHRLLLNNLIFGVWTKYLPHTDRSHLRSERSRSLAAAQVSNVLWTWRWDARVYILRSSDSRHKPVHIPRVRWVSQITPSVGDRTCGTVILGERAQLHWGDPAVMVHGLHWPVGWGMEAPRRCIPLSVALSIRALVCMVVRVAVWPGVGEPGMRSGARRYRPSTGLALESWGSQAAGTGSINNLWWMGVNTRL